MLKNKTVNLAGIAYESLVNGEGIRRVFFAQGCIHNCLGCFNKETHDFNGGIETSLDKLLEELKENPIIKGVTFSGGDPFEQGEEFAYLSTEIKKMPLSIWCYTGYTFEYILMNLKTRKGWELLINNIDVLVDGRFEEDKKEDNLKYRGSSNQRILNVKESLAKGESIIYMD
ncbi:MAG TPA: anaerobic ribonucleoside-triphosphate reductase activating protein [Clostridiaceae bacterium]